MFLHGYGTEMERWSLWQRKTEGARQRDVCIPVGELHVYVSVCETQLSDTHMRVRTETDTYRQLLQDNDMVMIW